MVKVVIMYGDLVEVSEGIIDRGGGYWPKGHPASCSVCKSRFPKCPKYCRAYAKRGHYLPQEPVKSCKNCNSSTGRFRNCSVYCDCAKAEKERLEKIRERKKLEKFDKEISRESIARQYKRK